MIEVNFTPAFIKQVKSTSPDLQEEIIEKVEAFKHKENHKLLKVHKLNGRLKDRYSFSVNYKIRILFIWRNKQEATLLALGDHDIYRN